MPYFPVFMQDTSISCCCSHIVFYTTVYYHMLILQLLNSTSSFVFYEIADISSNFDPFLFKQFFNSSFFPYMLLMFHTSNILHPSFFYFIFNSPLTLFIWIFFYFSYCFPPSISCWVFSIRFPSLSSSWFVLLPFFNIFSSSVPQYLFSFTHSLLYLTLTSFSLLLPLLAISLIFLWISCSFLVKSFISFRFLNLLLFSIICIFTSQLLKRLRT